LGAEALLERASGGLSPRVGRSPRRCHCVPVPRTQSLYFFHVVGPEVLETLLTVLFVCSLVVSVESVGGVESFLVVRDRPVRALVPHDSSFLQSREDRTDGVRLQFESVSKRRCLPRSVVVLVEEQDDSLGVSPFLNAVGVGILERSSVEVST